MTTQPPLNPDALEAGAKALLAVQQPEVSADYAWNVQFEDGRDELRNEARAAVSAYLAVAQPETQKLTDAEWQSFQAIPDQGCSHRAWVDARIAERVAAAQPVVTSVEELDALPDMSAVLDGDGFVLQKLPDDDDDSYWFIVGDTSSYYDRDIELPARVLYRPEVDDA